MHRSAATSNMSSSTSEVSAPSGSVKEGATLPGLPEMVQDYLQTCGGILAPSEFWLEMNRKNIRQLETIGYENFKRTVALVYFTWLLGPWSAQVRFLLTHVPLSATIRSAARTLCAGRSQYLSWAESLSHSFLTYMVYEYATRVLDPKLVPSLVEPKEGNPPAVYLKDQLISQDIVNSTLEYATITRVTGTASLKRVMELGSGYGRVGYVFLKQLPGVKYIIVDMPPALYVAQRYLCSQFPERKQFRFRRFESFNEVAAELEQSDIAFLMPSQLKLLPAKWVDLFINISSFHEMHLDLIDYFFTELERLTRGHFYTKQYKVYPLAIEGHIMKESDFPFRKHWKELFHRRAPVQADFFEVLFEMPSATAA